MGSFAVENGPQSAVSRRHILIFVTVGSSQYGFQRLVEKVDEIAPSLPLKVMVQSGCTGYVPRSVEWAAFLTYEEMMRKMAEATLIIGHASAGPILHSRKFKVPLIVVPRRPELKEHLDGHQVETGQAIANLPFIDVVWDVADLRNSILSILENPACLTVGRKPIQQVDELIKVIREFVNDHSGLPTPA